MLDHEALGAGAPPEAPEPPQEPGTAYSGAEDAPGSPDILNKAPSPQPLRPVRRVGTLTMGAALIAVGAAITFGMFAPGTDFTLLFKLSPLVLVALGCEVLWAAAGARHARLKYDFLSMIVCFLLILASLGAACVPAVLEYAEPGRSAAEARVERALYDETFARLKGNGSIADVRYSVCLRARHAPSDVRGIGDLLAEDRVYASVELDGDWADAAAFTAACRPVLDAVRALGVEPENISFTQRETPGGTADRFALEVQGAYQQDMADAQLAGYVRRRVYVPEAGCYMEPDALDGWKWEEGAREAEWEQRLQEAEARAEAAEEALVQANEDAEEELRQANEDADARIEQIQGEYERQLDAMRDLLAGA